LAKSNVSVQVPTSPPVQPQLSGSSLIWGAVIVQSLALVGAAVGGLLARRRRRELESLTLKLRNVNVELRRQREGDLHVCEADGDAEAMRSYRAALEVALETPAATHPIENYGTAESAIAGARREFSRSLQDGRECLRVGETSEAFDLCNNAITLSKDMNDGRAERSARKLLAQIYRAMDEPTKALQSLKESLALSEKLKDRSGDVDILGDIGDIYAEIGDYERAGKFYDMCCNVIREEEFSESMSPYWDC